MNKWILTAVLLLVLVGVIFGGILYESPGPLRQVADPNRLDDVSVLWLDPCNYYTGGSGLYVTDKLIVKPDQMMHLPRFQFARNQVDGWFVPDDMVITLDDSLADPCRLIALTPGKLYRCPDGVDAIFGLRADTLYNWGLRMTYMQDEIEKLKQEILRLAASAEP